jgi:hypothetical protein
MDYNPVKYGSIITNASNLRTWRVRLGLTYNAGVQTPPLVNGWYVWRNITVPSEIMSCGATKVRLIFYEAGEQTAMTSATNMVAGLLSADFAANNGLFQDYSASALVTPGSVIYYGFDCFNSDRYDQAEAVSWAWTDVSGVIGSTTSLAFMPLAGTTIDTNNLYVTFIFQFAGDS